MHAPSFHLDHKTVRFLFNDNLTKLACILHKYNFKKRELTFY